MAQDLVRHAQKNPHITAKDLQKRVADTGLAVHRTTIQRMLSNKDRHGGVVWQLEAREILCERKQDWIPTNIKKFIEAEESLGIPARR